MRFKAIVALAAVLVLAGTPALAAQQCAFPVPPRVIDGAGESGAKGAQLVQVWDVPDAPVYWSAADPLGTAFASFRAGAGKHVKVTDPVALLRASPGWGDADLLRNNALVAQRARDWITPAGCLEKLLLADQHARVDTFVRPTEFGALVLRSADRARLRIYVITINDDGIGRMSPLTEPVLADVRAGWRMVTALHNHNFHPGEPSLDGVLAPSSADAQFAANLAEESGLPSAWITNGLHTSRIPASDFSRFLPRKP